MALDAFVQLALIEKSKLVFGRGADVFLSFPLLSPITYAPDRLAAMLQPATAADYLEAANFARIVNFLPRDMVAEPGSAPSLWDIFGAVLARAEVASGSAGAVPAGSTAVLYDVAADGTRTESAAYRAYRQFRDAWIVATENYAARKSSGEASDDPGTRAAWTNVEEPALRAAIAEADANWTTFGFKAQVNAALQAERNAARNDPLLRWQDWTAHFNEDTDVLTDPMNGRYAPTGLSPRDFSGEGNWLRFDLSASEMASLVGAAPAALRVVLDDDGGGTIDHVSFEYRSVAIVRPWFNSDVLTSGIWRSSDPALALSDGGDPPSGSCPAYVTAVVLVRNLQITTRAAPAGSGPAPGDLRFTIPAQRLTRRDLRLEAVRPVEPVDPARLVPVQEVDQRAFQRLQANSFTVAPIVAPATAPQTLLRARAMEAVAPATPTPHVDLGARLQVRPDLLGHGVVRRFPVVADPAPPSPPPPRPEPEHADTISILAFICKRLPKAPNAMPGLTWG